MKDGFLKAAALSPALRVADCAYNAGQIVSALNDCARRGVKLAVLPELALTGYTCGDLFFQQALQQAALAGLEEILRASEGLDLVALVGLPLMVNGKLYNCAAVVCRGRLLGIVPKTCLPNYGEFYEKRHFAPGSKTVRTVTVCGQETLFGTSLLFACRQMPEFVLGVELCEDLWSVLPPSTFHAMAGATVIANLSASDETVGKAEYRRDLVSNQSARLLCGYLYASAGHGESTQDMVFAGHNLIAENGALLAESQPFGGGGAETELDCARMLAERARNTSFVPSEEGYQTVSFDLEVTDTVLTRRIDPAPFVPGDPLRRAQRCELILRMQADGLAKRIEHTHAKTAVIGISGGLDSCLALLVAARAMRQLGRPAADVLAVTMPCFGTTRRTRSNAEILCQELGVSFREVNITNTVRSHFADIGHDGQTPDVTFENSQARVRTLELMDIANLHGGFVVGTGDLSELALGWATYNGDHMSMYGVNAGVPKTLVRHLVQYEADTASSEELRRVLVDILDTPVSPELLPAKDGEIAQRTEELVGPYELHDFCLYYVLRFGFGPRKIFRLAQAAFAGRPEYPDAVLYKWLRSFYWRFFAQQFKRSCLPDGPKVGSVTLSPRGDWRMPSDASAAAWLAQLEELNIQ
ncbi:NAD(+) synthase [Faecalibacterium sp. An122]|uniref:NAD(+) synthase n=1 Tax=Faecalibacterium sp. An122 TaxID=1965551 RepID=UPI000B388C5D|nr:NAD(+) synthase [Faecalibacterium sp. An122]OUQ37776.1 NAD(+) synthase [Faecalibacterium sp. An122]